MEEKEIGLIDLLLVVVENLKLLILGPLVIGLLTLSVGYFSAPSYVSQAILAVPQTATTQTATTQAASMMVSPLVLDPVIRSLKLSGVRSIQVVRTELASQIKAVSGKDGLLRLDVTASTPLEAQSIANGVIDVWLKSTIPGEQERVDLEKRLAYARVSLESVRRLLDRLSTDGVSDLNKPLTRGEAGTSIVAVGELQARYLAEVLSIPRALQGLSRDIVMQSPTLPTEPVAQGKSLIVVLAALGSGFVLLLWVFMRQAWKDAAQDPSVAEKQARLLAAMGFKARVH